MRGRATRRYAARALDASTAAWEIADFQAFMAAFQISRAFNFAVDQLVGEAWKEELGIVKTIWLDLGLRMACQSAKVPTR